MSRRHIVTVFRDPAQNVPWLWTINTIHKHGGFSQLNPCGQKPYKLGGNRRLLYQFFLSLRLVFGPRSSMYDLCMIRYSSLRHLQLQPAPNRGKSKTSTLESVSIDCLGSYGLTPSTKSTGASLAPRLSPRSAAVLKHTTGRHHESSPRFRDDHNQGNSVEYGRSMAMTPPDADRPRSQ